MIKLSTTVSLLLICLAISSCDTSPPPKKEPTPPSPSTTDVNIKQNTNLTRFLDTAEVAFKQLSESGTALQHSIKEFIQTPSPERLNAAKKALLNTHHQYMLVQVFQKIDIFHPEFDLLQNQPTVIHPLNIRLDQHPIISGYLDAVPNYPASGLIFVEQTLSAEYLNNEHQFSDTAYVAIGFHALELMLTGGLKQTPAERSLEFSGLNTSNKNTPSYRRSRYVQLLTTLINNDLKKLSAAWTTNNGIYPQTLNELLPDESDRLIQQAYKIEEHALSQIKEHEKDGHSDAINERKAQLTLILKSQNTKQDR